MLIDWFTVVAQIVNFVVLIALLKHFLFGRLVAAVDQREKRIAARLAEADAKRLEAERQVEIEHEKTLEIDRKRGELLEEAKLEADRKRDTLIENARQSVRALEAKWREDLEHERRAFLEEVRQRAASEILAVVGRALADLACQDVQHCATEVLLEKLQSLDAATLFELARNELIVLTPKELEEAAQKKIREVIESRLQASVQLRFERAPGISWGIELRGSGRRIGWNAESYMETLEENLKEALEHRLETVIR